MKELLRDATAGDPMGGLRWTHKTTRNLAAALTRRGVAVGHVTVARLLRAQKYSLRSNRKRLGGKKDPYRDRQFRLLGRRRRRFQRQGWPVISVDTKKKELVATLIPGACVKTFPLAGGDVKELVVSGKDAGPVDWPPLAPLALHKEEWLAVIDRAVVRIREVLDRRPKRNVPTGKPLPRA